MRIARVALRICSLVTSDVTRLKSCFFRRYSTFAEWDSSPISNTIWHGREIDMKDLRDPVRYFKAIPMFQSIRLNNLVGRCESRDKKRLNPFLARILKMNPLMVTEEFAFALRSLAIITVENHRRGVLVGNAAKLANLKVSYSHGKLVLLNIPPKSPDSKGLTLRERCDDWVAVRRLIEKLVEETHCGKCVQYPMDFSHWLEKLEEHPPRIFLILYHTIFLRWNARFYYHISVDQFCRKEPKGEYSRTMKVSDLLGMLRKIGDLRGLLNLAELNELLNCCLTGEDGVPPASVAPGGQRPAFNMRRLPSHSLSQIAAAYDLKSGLYCNGLDQQQSQAALAPGDHSQSYISQGNSKSSQPAEAQAQPEDPNLQEIRLHYGRLLVAFHRNSPIHGPQKSCQGFDFIEKWMVNRRAIIELIYFTCLPFDHTVLELSHVNRVDQYLDMEGLFGETRNTFRFAIRQHWHDLQP